MHDCTNRTYKKAWKVVEVYRKDKREDDRMNGGDKREKYDIEKKLWIVGMYREDEWEDDSIWNIICCNERYGSI